MSSDPTKTGVKYIGNDAPFVDNLYGSGLKFMPNQTRLVEHDLAAKLIRHAEFVEDVGFDYVTANSNPLTGGVSIPALSQMTSGVTLSRSLSLIDSDQVLKCNSGSAIVLTIPNDATALWDGLNSVGAYQAGVGAVSFAAGAGVTLRGTAPTPTQYTTQGVMRVAANEWAYL